MGNLIMTRHSDLGNIKYDPKRNPPNHPMNPKTIFPIFRMDDKILGFKIEKNAAGEISKSHFIFKEIIGKGQFGMIWLVTKLPEMTNLVIKIIDKCDMYNKRCVETILNE